MALYTIHPDDILRLFQFLTITFYNPFTLSVNVDEYKELQKKISYAVKNPAVFGIVWAVMYTLISTSVFLLYLERDQIETWIAYTVFSLYGVILITTKIWTPLFFGISRRQSPSNGFRMLAFVDLVVLFVAVVLFTVLCFLADKSYADWFFLPGVLMLPLIPWLIYAGYLNYNAIDS